MTLDLPGIASSVAQVLVVGLLLGAGLPALFALGIRSLAAADGDSGGRTSSARLAPAASRTIAYLCFGATVLVALLGVVVIVFGKQLFGH